MRNLSSEFIQKVKNGDRNFFKYADLNLKDGTKLSLTNQDFWQNGFSYTDSVSSDTEFSIGSAIINTLKLTLNNIYDDFTEYVLDGASVVAYIGMEVSNGIEKVKIGEFTVVEAPKQNSDIITLTCEDNMRKFDRDYSESTLSYPATLLSIVQDACTTCGVTLQTYDFPHNDYTIQSKPDPENLTFRQVISWVAQIACCFCRCDENGDLELKWFETAVDEDSSNYVQISETVNTTINLDDVVITGIRVTEYISGDDSSENTPVFQAGSNGYVLSIEDNKLILEGTGNTIASMIAESVVGIKFRPFSVSCLTDPRIEAGDVIYITDRKGFTYMSYVTTTTFNPGNFQTVACNAISAERQSEKRYSQISQFYTDLRKTIQKEKTQREQAIEALANRISESDGVFTTIEKTESGANIYYLHNKPLLEDSDIVWRMTAEAWGVSTDSGKTWNAGMTVDGDTIVRILTATGINADWINTGKIEVKDTEGKTIFLVNKDTNQVVISGDFVSIGDQTLVNAITLSKSLSVTLTNEYQGISTDWEGNYTNFPICKTTASVMYGSMNVSDQSSYSITKSAGVVGSWDSSLRTYTVTDLLSDNGWVDIQATYLDNLSLTKRFTITKIKSGKPGADGTSVTILGTKDSVSDLPLEGNEIGDGWIVSGDLYVWNGTEWSNAGKIQGPAGEDGRSSYLHIKYSNDGGETFTDGNGETPGTYIGQYVDFIENDSENTSDYTWSKFVGTDGKGIKTSEVTYQKSENGTEVPSGIWVKTIPEVEAGLYLWTRTTITYDDDTTTISYSVSQMGTPGKVYSLEYPVKILKRSSEFSISPTRVRLNAYCRTGDGNRERYYGRFVVEGSSDGTTWEEASYTSIENENTVVLYVGNLCNVPYSESNKLKITATSDNYHITSDYFATLRSGVQYTLTFKSEANVGSNGDTVELFLILDKTSSTIIRVTSKNFTFTPTVTGKYYVRFEVNQNGKTYNFWDVNIQQVVNGTVPVPISRDWIVLRCSLYSKDGISDTNLMDVGTISILTDVSALTHEQIFNLLTNNGEIKGIYKEGNQLYVSATYIKTGTLSVGGSDDINGVIEVRDALGMIVAKLNKDGVTANKGSFTGNIFATGGTIEGSMVITGTLQTSYLGANTETLLIQNGTLGFVKNITTIDSIGLLSGISELSSSTHYLSFNSMTGGRGIALCLNNEPKYVLNKTEYAVSGHNETHIFFGSAYFDSIIEFADGVYLSGNSMRVISSTEFMCYGLLVTGDLSVTGTKNRAVNTRNYGTIGMNAFESADALFSDFGSAQIGEDGTIDVYIDPIFLETIDTQHIYRVFITQTSKLKIEYVEKFTDFFRIYGEPNGTCDWMLVAKQRGYVSNRMESLEHQIYQKEDVAYDTLDDSNILDSLAQQYLENFEKELLYNEY